MRRCLALVLVTLAPTAAAAAETHKCVADRYTTVCGNGATELRIIQNTISPSRQYGIAWEAPADPRKVEIQDDGSKYLEAATDNFIVRLGDGKIEAKLATEHFGDHARYNFNEILAVWSPDSRYVAVVYYSKWTTDVADVYRLAANGSASKPAALMPICRAVGKQAEAKLRDEQGPNYEHTLDVKSVGNDGVMSVKCSMQVMKGDDGFDFTIHVQLDAGERALAARLLDARRCGDDEEGPCAVREMTE
jgi:hypothetical protein